MESKLEFQIKDAYTIVVPRELGSAVLDVLPARVESLLMERKQDLVLSLRHVETVFSIHLTAFVQIYKLLKSFNLRFIIVDISPAVLNVMQMTQLESLLPLYLTLEDYEESLQNVRTENYDAREISFDYTAKREGAILLVECRGYMAFGPKIREMQDLVQGEGHAVLDFSGVGYIETRVLILLADLAHHVRLDVRGISVVLRELFDQHRLTAKFASVQEL